MSSFSSLEIGKRALLAQKFGLDVTSNNIANVNTDGYSRRQAVLSETSPVYTSSGYLGSGVIASRIKTFRQEFYDKEMRNSISLQSNYNTDSLIYGRIETILAEPTENGINEEMADFFAAFEELSLTPEDVGIRENVLGVAKSLVDRFHSTAQHLLDAREEVRTSMSMDIDTANSLIKGIADLNGKITATYATSAGQAQTYIDQREVLLEDLSELSGVTVSQGEFGDVNVFLNGINVVTGPVYAEIKLHETLDDTTGELTASIVKTDEEGNITATIDPESGSLKSYLTHYNVTLDDNDSSGGFSIRKRLDDLAQAIVTKVNDLTSTGYSLLDNTGINFFEPAVGEANALNIEISDDVKDNPRNIPVSSGENEPGNNDIALAIANLSSDENFLDGSTPSGYYSAILGTLGTMGSESANGLTAAELVIEQLDLQRESEIGVSLDEEAVNLIKFQKAYQASSQVINTTNDLLEVLINLGR